MVSTKSLGAGEVEPSAIQRLWQLLQSRMSATQVNPFGSKADKEHMENCQHNQFTNKNIANQLEIF